MKEEFDAYGLPPWMLRVVGTLKVGSAIALLLAIPLPIPIAPAAWIVAVLMTGAVAMHIKVGDPAKKMLPAATMLLLSLILIFA